MTSRCYLWSSPNTKGVPGLSLSMKSRIPLPAKKSRARSGPCLRPGAPYQILPSARHREGAEGRGSFGGIFIFSQFSGQIYSAGIWSRQHWGRVSDGWFKSPYRAWSLGPIRPLSAALRHNCGGALWKRRYLNLAFTCLCKFIWNQHFPWIECHIRQFSPNLLHHQHLHILASPWSVFQRANAPAPDLTTIHHPIAWNLSICGSLPLLHCTSRRNINNGQSIEAVVYLYPPSTANTSIT